MRQTSDRLHGKARFPKSQRKSFLSEFVHVTGQVVDICLLAIFETKHKRKTKVQLSVSVPFNHSKF